MVEQEQQEIPVDTPETITPESLNWNGLMFLAKQSWGLRHTKSLAVAEKQIKDGIEAGDAVSIASPDKFIPQEALKDLDPNQKDNLPLYFLSQFLSDEEKAQTISGFEAAILKFCETCVGLDLNSLPQDLSIEEVLQKLVNSRLGFLIAKFSGADFPYETDNYYGLGKCGKQKVPPENMVAIIKLDDTEKLKTELGLSDDNMETALTKEKFDGIVEVIGRQILKKVISVINERQK